MDDYDDEEDFDFIEIPAQRFSKVTLLAAALDFLGHTLEGARCAVGRIEAAVMSHEVRIQQERMMHEELAWSLEQLPETEEG